jgi:hypothetical protein
LRSRWSSLSESLRAARARGRPREERDRGGLI